MLVHAKPIVGHMRIGIVLRSIVRDNILHVLNLDQNNLYIRLWSFSLNVMHLLNNLN